MSSVCKSDIVSRLCLLVCKSNIVSRLCLLFVNLILSVGYVIWFVNLIVLIGKVFWFVNLLVYIGYIIYSYNYLESDLIKHCHVIFIHSLGQPLIVRSHSKAHRSRGNPKEIPTWASCVSKYSYFPWFNRQRTLRSATGLLLYVGEEEILYIISNIFAKPQPFCYLVSDAKIFDIIYQLLPLLECDPTVCLPSKSIRLPSGDLTFL
jgi:hypothetical protein